MRTISPKSPESSSAEDIAVFQALIRAWLHSTEGGRLTLETVGWDEDLAAESVERLIKTGWLKATYDPADETFCIEPIFPGEKQ